MITAHRGYCNGPVETAFASAYGDWNGRAEALFSAAQRYIRLHLGKKGLNADEIARAIGCSRANLYRLFASHDLTVKGHIRDLRLQKLKTFLENPDRSVPIAVLAQRCGLFDTPNVNRAFRQRFGFTPSEVRAGRNVLRQDDRQRKTEE